MHAMTNESVGSHTTKLLSFSHTEVHKEQTLQSQFSHLSFASLVNLLDENTVTI